MGLNLCVARVSFAPFALQWLPHDEWDSDRWAWDREFAAAHGGVDGPLQLPQESHWDARSEMGVWRPLDFGRSAAWVREHIEAEDNRARLLGMLGRMGREPDLWFYESW